MKKARNLKKILKLQQKKQNKTYWIRANNWNNKLEPLLLNFLHTIIGVLTFFRSEVNRKQE